MTDSLADIHDVALLDLDGVVYVGEHAVPHAVDGLAAARAHGMVLTFVTNNASRPADVVAEHLTGLGVSAAADEVVTSAQAGAALMVERLGTGAAVLAVGGPGVTEALLAADLAPVHADVNGRVGAVGGVLQGFGRAVAWSDLCAAALAVQDGAVWIATNPDMSLPIVGGRAPGNGALVAAVAAAVGREPDDIAGKPFPALMRASMDRTHAVRPLVVGDRLDTDIAGAHAVAVPSLLVFTGVSDVEAVLTAPAGQRPTYLGADLGALTATPRATTGGDREAQDPDEWADGLLAQWVEQMRESNAQATNVSFSKVHLTPPQMRVLQQRIKHWREELETDSNARFEGSTVNEDEFTATLSELNKFDLQPTKSRFSMWDRRVPSWKKNSSLCRLASVLLPHTSVSAPPPFIIM